MTTTKTSDVVELFSVSSLMGMGMKETVAARVSAGLSYFVQSPPLLLPEELSHYQRLLLAAAASACYGRSVSRFISLAINSINTGDAVEDFDFAQRGIRNNYGLHLFELSPGRLGTMDNAPSFLLQEQREQVFDATRTLAEHVFPIIELSDDRQKVLQAAFCDSMEVTRTIFQDQVLGFIKEAFDRTTVDLVDKAMGQKAQPLVAPWLDCFRNSACPLAFSKNDPHALYVAVASPKV